MKYSSLSKEELKTKFGGEFSITASGPERRQAGGHYGTMTYENGFFQKPVRKTTELTFYEAAKTPELAVFNEKHLIPKFIGVNKNGDVSTMTIEDVSSAFKAPCVVDIKMGTQTWQPGCREEYRIRKTEQDALCTTKTFGFRFSGACFPDATYGHDFGWYANTDKQMLECLHAILQCVPSDRLQSVLDVFIERVQTIRDAVASIEWSFIASSLLFVYEGSPDSWTDPVVSLIDFEHTEPTPGTHDNGFLFGCDNLLRFLNMLKTE